MEEPPKTLEIHQPYQQSSPGALIRCHICPPESAKLYKGSKGLKLHCNSAHSTGPSTASTQPDISNPTEEIDNVGNSSDFITLLSRCKRNVKVLKRIPRGARILAANKLTQCIDDCLANPKADQKMAKTSDLCLHIAPSSNKNPKCIINVVGEEKHCQRSSQHTTVFINKQTSSNFHFKACGV